MKKMSIILLLVAFCVTISGVAFAAQNALIGDASGDSYGSTVFGGGTYKPSTKVTVSVYSSTTGYCATSQHSGAAGNTTAGKQFGTLATSPAIPYATTETTATPKACTAATALPSPTTGTWTY